jgi:hypothetical protein
MNGDALNKTALLSPHVFISLFISYYNQFINQFYNNKVNLGKASFLLIYRALVYIYINIPLTLVFEAYYYKTSTLTYMVMSSGKEKETDEQMAMPTTNAMLSSYNQAQEAATMVSALSHVMARDPTGGVDSTAWQCQTTGLPYDMPSASTTSLVSGGMNYYQQGYIHEVGSYPYDQQYKFGAQGKYLISSHVY